MKNLIEKIKEADRKAVDRLVEETYAQIFAIGIAYFRETERAEELVQETYLRVWLHIDRVRDDRKLYGWVLRIAQNLARDWYKMEQRFRKREKQVDLERIPEIPSADTSGDGAKREERYAALEEAIRDLQEEERQMVCLHVIGGKTKKEIAAILKVHPSTVGRRIDQTLSRLGERITELEMPEERLSLKKKQVFGAFAALTSLSLSEQKALAGTLVLPKMSILVQKPVLYGITMLALVFPVSLIFLISVTFNQDSSEVEKLLEREQNNLAQILAYNSSMKGSYMDGEEHTYVEEKVRYELGGDYTIKRYHFLDETSEQLEKYCFIERNGPVVVEEISKGVDEDPFVRNQFSIQEGESLSPWIVHRPIIIAPLTLLGLEKVQLVGESDSNFRSVTGQKDGIEYRILIDKYTGFLTTMELLNSKGVLVNSSEYTINEVQRK